MKSVIHFPLLACLFLLVSAIPSASAQDVRGFMVEIDHTQSFLSIHALFYSKNNTEAERTHIEKGLRFWNTLSDRYLYRLQDGSCYSIQFDLRYPKGEYDEGGFFMPSLTENHAVLNQVEIVSDSLLNRTNSDPSRMVIGYSPNNSIYIGQSYYDWESVWIHEIGHRIGASHHHGIMSRTLSWGHNGLGTGTMKGMLANAGISFPNSQLLDLSHHDDIRPAKIVHVGDMPSDFFTSGKLIKRRNLRKKCTNYPQL